MVETNFSTLANEFRKAHKKICSCEISKRQKLKSDIFDYMYTVYKNENWAHVFSFYHRSLLLNNPYIDVDEALSYDTEKDFIEALKIMGIKKFTISLDSKLQVKRFVDLKHLGVKLEGLEYFSHGPYALDPFKGKEYLAYVMCIEEENNNE